MNNCSESTLRKLLNTFGIAYRARQTFTGQDKIFEAIRCSIDLDVFVTDDVSVNVMRKLKAAEERGSVSIFILYGTDRKMLGRALGINETQVTALPRDSGFSQKILQLLNDDRSDANE
ncbi:MAG: hypothetical protein Q4E17_05385 [Synergistes sp.]|nr:hypothetical protein [Synergistes sp.]